MLTAALLPALLAAPARAQDPADDRLTLAPGLTVHYADLLADGQVLGRTGRVLVGLRDGADSGPLRALGAVDLGGGVYRVQPAPGADDLALARALGARADVEFAMPDLVLPLVLHGTPDDPLVADEWHLENTGQGGRTADVDIDVAPAWARATGAGQTIAIIDSGVQLDHPDLVVTSGHDYIDRDDDASPDYADPYSAPHGTGTAGIAAGLGNNGYGVAGVAFDAQVYAVRLIGGATTTEDVYDAFVESVDAGASVLSNSWGYGGCGEVPASNVFTRMYRYAENQGRGGLGSVVVFASGNDGCDIADNGMLNMEWPVVVAAVESSDVRASYSNYGDAVDIAAPTGLLTTDWTSGGYGSYGGDDAFSDGFSGTSGATPVVAGVVALMFEANPRLTAAQARQVLCATAQRIDLAHVRYDADGRAPEYGCGMVDAGAAVAAVANQPPEAPLPTAATEQQEGRVWLSWDTAVDPDADALTYVVRVTSAEADLVEWTAAEPRLRLDLPAGSSVQWTVAAVDPWGEGPESEAAALTVTAAPVAEAPAPEDAGCSTGGAAPDAGWILAGVALALRRRR